MGANVWIDGPLGCQAPDPPTPVPRSFTAYGGYLYDAARGDELPARKIVCRLLRTDTDPLEVVCTVDPCDESQCEYTRWTAAIVVPNAVPYNTPCRLEVAMWVGGSVVDSDATQYLELKSDAPPVVVPDCEVTTEDAVRQAVRRPAAAAPVGVAAAAGGLAGVVQAGAAAPGKPCCCRPKPGPVPYTHAWDFVAGWTPEITSAVCVVYDRLSGRIDSTTPAQMSLGRVVARFLIPLQLGRERYTARFLLFAEDKTRPVRNSPPASLPPNYPPLH